MEAMHLLEHINII